MLSGKQSLRLLLVIVVLIAIWIGLQSLQKEDKSSETNLTNTSSEVEIKAPVFAEKLNGVHSIARDDMGNFWVSQPEKGKVSLIEISNTGEVRNVSAVFSNLNYPTELAVGPDNGLKLYIVEKDKLSYVRLYTEDALHKMTDIPKGAEFTDISFGENGNLFAAEKATGKIYSLTGE